jgi:hypothetical protein
MQIPWRESCFDTNVECQLDDYMWATVNRVTRNWAVYREQERLAYGTCEDAQAAQKRAEIVLRALAAEEP